MVRSIIKYVGIALVIVGILLVMKNLFAKDDWSTTNKKETVYYSAKIKLLDKETENYLEGSKLVLKDKDGKVVAEWTTENKVYVVKNLKNGKYNLVQESAPENYHLNETGITFEIKSKDKNIVMYNTKMTEEEIKEANTKETEVGVDNTGTSKNVFIGLLAMLMTGMGLNLIYKVNKDY